MGLIISTLRDLYFSVRAVVGELTASNTAFSAVLARISSSPGLPVPHPTASFWQQEPPFPALVNAQSATLPAATEVAIIGSGMTAASVAWTVLNERERERQEKGADADDQQRRNIVVLDARSVCSGATGRNGGHIKCTPYELFSHLKRRLGAERARAVVAFQMSHLRLLVDMGAARGWAAAAETRDVETVDLFLDGAGWRRAKAMVDELRAGMPDVARDVHVWEAQEAREVSGLLALALA
jgi:glycine/D-amino acid oxidase-like deaminating enzyme